MERAKPLRRPRNIFGVDGKKRLLFGWLNASRFVFCHAKALTLSSFKPSSSLPQRAKAR